MSDDEMKTYLNGGRSVEKQDPGTCEAGIFYGFMLAYYVIRSVLKLFFFDGVSGALNEKSLQMVAARLAKGIGSGRISQVAKAARNERKPPVIIINMKSGKTNSFYHKDRLRCYHKISSSRFTLRHFVRIFLSRIISSSA